MYVIDADPDQPTTTIPAADTAGPAAAESAGVRARRIAERQHRNTLAAVHHAQREAHLQLHRTESKATSLVAVFAVTLAAALVLARTVHTQPAGWLVTAAALPLLAAFAAVLSVLRTRLVEHVPGVRRWALFGEHPDALAADVDLPVRRQIRAQADRLAQLSAAAVSAARRINAALVLLLAGLGLLTLAALPA